MRKSVIAVVAVVLAAAIFVVWMAGRREKPQLMQLPAQVRGAWVTAWGRGHMNAAEVDRTIEAAKRARLNVLFIECRKTADAYYKSSLEPMGADVESGFDPLGYTIEKAHKQGIQVHAWVSVYRVWRGSTRPTDPEHLINRHPEWLSYSRSGKLNAVDGIFMNPASPEATAHITRLVRELVSNYDIDGLHLDFIRYPQREWGYSDAAMSRYGKPVPDPDDPQWQQWKRDQVTRHLREMVAEVHATKPNLPITAATITYGECPTDFTETVAYKHLGQDWRRWLAERLLDANLPMNYKRLGNPDEARRYEDWLGGFSRWNGGRPTYVGLAAYLNTSQQIADQARKAEAAGMNGFVVFCFNESGIRVNEDREKLVEQLAGVGR